jgi:hypothetical protein
MNFLARLNEFIALFISAAKQLGRGTIWLFLLLYALVSWLVLYAHYDFLAASFYGVISAWMGLFPDVWQTMFAHYPGHFLAMPYVTGRAQLVVGLILEGLILGAVAVVFFNAYMRNTNRPALPVGRAFSMWLNLILVWVVINGLMFVLTTYLPDLIAPLISSHPRRLRLFQYVVMPFFFVLILSLFYFAIPSVVIFGENVFQALRRSLSIFRQRPFTAFFLAFFILLGPIAMSMLAGQAQTIVSKFRPEMVYYVLIAGLVVYVGAQFFWMGTAVKFLADRIES